MGLLKTWDDNKNRLDRQRWQIAKEVLLLDSIHWIFHFSVDFPSTYNKKRDLIKRELDAFCRDIDRGYKIRLVASGVIVYRPKCSPHAHLALSSLPAKGTRNLSQIKSKQLLELWGSKKGRIAHEKQWAQETVQGYIPDEKNMRMDGRKDRCFDTFKYNHGRLRQFADAYGKGKSMKPGTDMRLH